MIIKKSIAEFLRCFFVWCLSLSKAMLALRQAQRPTSSGFNSLSSKFKDSFSQ